MDLSFITRPRGVEIPDPVDTYKQRISLAEIGRAGQLHQLQLDERRRAQEEQDALRNVLGDLHAGGYSDDAIRSAITKAPQAGKAILATAYEARKKRADEGKDLAETDAKKVDTSSKRYVVMGSIAGQLAENPTREGWLAAKRNAQLLGFDPAVLEVPDGMEPREHFAALAQQSLTRAQQMTVRDRDLVRAETGRHNVATEGLTAAGHGVTMRGQDLGAQVSREGHGVQRRGQDMVNARAIDATAATREATSGTKLNAETQALAKFVDGNALPNLITSANALDSALRQYRGKDIPGVGMTGLLPPIMTSPEGKLVRSKVQGVSNDLLKLYSGGAVTLNEAERRAVEMMASGTFTDEDLRNAWPLVKGRIDAAVANVRGGFSPQAIETYQQRGGLKLAPIGSQDNQPIGGRPAAPQRGQVVDGWLFNGGDPADKANWRRVN